MPHLRHGVQSVVLSTHADAGGLASQKLACTRGRVVKKRVKKTSTLVGKGKRKKKLFRSHQMGLLLLDLEADARWQREFGPGESQIQWRREVISCSPTMTR